MHASSPIVVTTVTTKEKAPVKSHWVYTVLLRRVFSANVNSWFTSRNTPIRSSWSRQLWLPVSKGVYFHQNNRLCLDLNQKQPRNVTSQLLHVTKAFFVNQVKTKSLVLELLLEEHAFQTYCDKKTTISRIVIEIVNS